MTVIAINAFIIALRILYSFILNVREYVHGKTKIYRPVYAEFYFYHLQIK